VNDELQRRITEHVLNGDAPSIIWAMEAQIRINTKLEAKLAELERREALLTEGYLAYEADWFSEHPVWSEEGLRIEARLEAARAAIADAGLTADGWIPQP
jgi:hypothetical protein